MGKKNNINFIKSTFQNILNRNPSDQEVNHFLKLFIKKGKNRLKNEISNLKNLNENKINLDDLNNLYKIYFNRNPSIKEINNYEKKLLKGKQWIINDFRNSEEFKNRSITLIVLLDNIYDNYNYIESIYEKIDYSIYYKIYIYTKKVTDKLKNLINSNINFILINSLNNINIESKYIICSDNKNILSKKDYLNNLRKINDFYSIKKYLPHKLINDVNLNNIILSKNDFIYFNSNKVPYYYKLYSNFMQNNFELISYQQNMENYYGKNDNIYYVKNISGRDIWLTNFIVNYLMKNPSDKENDINIDINLYKYLHNFKNGNICDEIYFNGVIKGNIYSIKQIRNHLDIVDFYKSEIFDPKYYLNRYGDLKNGFINSIHWNTGEYENKSIEYKARSHYNKYGIHEGRIGGFNTKYYGNINNLFIDLRLIKESIYEKTFDYHINDFKLIENEFTSNNDHIICCYIGNCSIGKKLLEKILNSNKVKLPILIIFGKYENYLLLKNLCNKFVNKFIFLSKEYGNDIIPTLQIINFIQKYDNIKYIYKFHTKGDNKWFNDCTDYLLENDYLNSYLDFSYCNCLTHPKYIIDVNKVGIKKHCEYLKNLYKFCINKTKFTAGSIFYTSNDVYKKIINFVKCNNYRSFFLNNTYDHNFVNFETSPIHFLERLFGIIK